MNKKGTFVASIILGAIATLAVAIAALFYVDLFPVVILDKPLEDVGEGIGLFFMLIFFFIFVIAGFVLSTISFILGIITLKKQGKAYGLSLVIINSIYMFACLAAWLSLYISNIGE